jgi:hypothetical protein
MEALLKPKKPLMREAIRGAISMHSIRAAARAHVPPTSLKRLSIEKK